STRHHGVVPSPAAMAAAPIDRRPWRCAQLPRSPCSLLRAAGRSLSTGRCAETPTSRLRAPKSLKTRGSLVAGRRPRPILGPMAEPTRTRVPVRVEAAGDTHIGGRSHNEDAILLRPDLNLYLVADGAGGQNAGNVAASLAISTIAHFFE